MKTRAYRTLVWLYPRGFRREYGADVVQAFRDDVAGRGVWRAGWRAAVDLVVSVPNQHLEAAMSGEHHTEIAGFVLIAVAAVVLLVLGGVVGIIGVVLLAGIMVAVLRSRAPYREALRDLSSAWWIFLVTGGAILGTIIVATGAGPDFDWFPWILLFALVVFALVLVAAGVLLGAVALTRRLRGGPVVAD